MNTWSLLLYSCWTNSLRLILGGAEQVCSSYLGQRTFFSQSALVGVSEQLFEGVPYCGVGPLI